MALFYFNHDNKDSINTYFRKLKATELDDVEDGIACVEESLIFVHLKEERDKWCELDKKGVYVIFMSTHTSSLSPTGLNDYVHNCEFPADRLTEYLQIEKFIKGFSSSHQWDLLKKRLFPEALMAAYLLTIANEKVGVPLRTMSNEQWNEAFSQFQPVRKEGEEDWSKACEWSPDKVREIREKIRVKLSQVTSNS